jgi:hypothetical protein
LPIKLPTDTGEGTSQYDVKTNFPPDGDYEVLNIDTGERSGERKDGVAYQDNFIQLSLLNEDSGETNLVNYRYEITKEGKLKATKAGGRLSIALEALGFKGDQKWAIEGEKFTFEATTFELPGRDGKEALVYECFIPVSKVETSNKAPSKGSSKASGNGYDPEAVGMLLSIVAEAGDAGIAHAKLFKELVNQKVGIKDKVLMGDLAAGKAKIEGVRKEGQKYFLDDGE